MWNILATLMIFVAPSQIPAVHTGPAPGSSLEGMNQAIQQRLIREQWERDQMYALKARNEASRWSADWDGIAQCETGSDWSMVGPRFSGGLGFYNGTWDGFGGRQFADYAGHATKAEQIIVAERVYAKYGLSGWGCRAYG